MGKGEGARGVGPVLAVKAALASDSPSLWASQFTVSSVSGADSITPTPALSPPWKEKGDGLTAGARTAGSRPPAADSDRRAVPDPSRSRTGRDPPRRKSGSGRPRALARGARFPRFRGHGWPVREAGGRRAGGGVRAESETEREQSRPGETSRTAAAPGEQGGQRGAGGAPERRGARSAGRQDCKVTRF